MERKGQAAMEFLMTYGWAILAAVIAIGVLAYFGVFSPGKYVAEACTLTAPFSCEEYAVTTNQIDLVIRNGAGESADISNITIDDCTSYTPSPAEAVASGNIIEGAGAADSKITFVCVISTNTRYKGNIVITYTKTGGTISQTATGTITGKA